MPAELRTPARSKGNLFAKTVRVWNTLTFVTSSSFLDVTGFLPYTKWTLPYLQWSSYEEWHIHKLYYLGYERGRAKETIESFWHSIHLLQSICFVQSETLAYFCYHQCINAKHSKIFWIKNILNKLLFLFDNSKLINKFFTALT